jgi:chorismate mutase
MGEKCLGGVQEDIHQKNYNPDKTGLFYNMINNIPLNLQMKNVLVAKKLRNCLRVLICANMSAVDKKITFS